MTFNEAVAKMASIADGEYFSVGYDYGHHSAGQITRDCNLYLHKYGSCKAPTWEEVFSIMMERMGVKTNYQDIQEPMEDIRGVA